MELKQVDFDKKSDGTKEDETDFKISPETRRRAKKVWAIVSFILSWASVVLFIWDDVSAFLAYRHWGNVLRDPSLQSCQISWLVFTCMGVLVTILVVYNTLCHSLKYLCSVTVLHPLKHQYTACIAFYVHEIPKSIVYLVLVAKYRIIPELKLVGPGTQAPPVYFLGLSRYDHIYFKIVPDVLKMVALFLLGLIEFREVTKKDKSKVFLVLNCLGMVFHQSFIVSSTVLKIIIEQRS